jgi:hypothetical protein
MAGTVVDKALSAAAHASRGRLLIKMCERLWTLPGELPMIDEIWACECQRCEERRHSKPELRHPRKFAKLWLRIKDVRAGRALFIFDECNADKAGVAPNHSAPSNRAEFVERKIKFVAQLTS